MTNTLVTKTRDNNSVTFNFGNIQADKLINETALNTYGGLHSIAAGGIPIYQFGRDATAWFAYKYYWDRVVPGIGYYGGYYPNTNQYGGAGGAVLPNSDLKIYKTLNDKTTNPDRWGVSNNIIDFTADFVGPKFNQVIEGQYIWQEAYGLPHDPSDGGITQLPDWGNLHSFICLWDFSNCRYSADFRNYYSDASRNENPELYGGDKVQDWLYGGGDGPRARPWDGSGGDGVTLHPAHWSYFSTTPQGIEKLVAKMIELAEVQDLKDPPAWGGYHNPLMAAYDPANADVLIAIAKENNTNNQQDNLVKQHNNLVDFLSTTHNVDLSNLKV